MHIWTDLLTREAVFLVVLLALGAGPAALLSERLDGVTRLVLAPALGLCVGVTITTTLVQYAPVQHTYWVLYPVAAISLAFAVWRQIRARTTFALPVREFAQIVVIAVVVLGPPTSTLHTRATVGPVALNVYDAAGYVAEIDSQQTRSIEEASARLPPYTDLQQENWADYARAYQNVDVSALEGSVNDILGLAATDTQSPFMIVILLAGALGAFAAFRYATDSRSWAGALAGGLFGGAYFMQLWADSSEAAICGLSLLLPFIVVGAHALRSSRLRDCCVLGLLAAGLLATYPLFAPPMALGSAIVLAVLGVRALRRGKPTLRQAGAVVLRVATVIVLAGALAPIAFGRDVRYWESIFKGQLSYTGLPVYHLPVDVLPGWLLQTRQFYFLSAIGRGGAKEFLFAVVIPVALLGLIVFALRAQRRILILIPFVLMCFVLAEYVAAHNNCGYCTQRNLLPVAPMATVALAVGVAGLFALRTRLGQVAGIIAAVVIVGAVAERVRAERTLVLDTAYFLDSSNRSVLSHLPAGHPTVQVEGFGATLRGPGEMPLVYDLVNERTHGHASIVIDSLDYSSFAYLGPPKQPAALNPRYAYVLTRFAGVRSGRSVIARSGGIALERPAQPLDVTPFSGLGAPLARLDPGGMAWIQGGLLPDRLGFKVIGGSSPTQPAWVHLEIAKESPVGLVPQRGVTSRDRGKLLGVCIRTTGTAPVRQATLGLSFTPIAGPLPPETYTLPPPAEGVELLSMSASTSGCTP
ncbi:MAG: hypothetical protein WAU75_08005 [Solirubrobacteraceae bacterium]